MKRCTNKINKIYTKFIVRNTVKFILVIRVKKEIKIIVMIGKTTVHIYNI